MSAPHQPQQNQCPQDPGRKRPLPHLRRLSALVALALAGPAQAVLINDRVAAAAGGVSNYHDAANSMPGVVSLFIPSAGFSNCTGSLINSRTVLTAAHCLTDGETRLLDITAASTEIRFSANANTSSVNDRLISGVAIHPWFPKQEGSSRDGDVALISLAAPVTSVATIQLIQPGESIPKTGSLVVIAGYGTAGDGQGNTLDGGKRRIAQTNIGTYERLDASDLAKVYLAQFRNPDAPTDPDRYNLSSQGVPVPVLQGSNGPGDSGGPLFLVMPDGSLRQVGTVIGSPEPHPLAYGVVTIWSGIAQYGHWLDANNPLRSTFAAGGTRLWSDPSTWTDTLGRHERPDNVDGNFTSGLGNSASYYQVNLNRAGTLTTDIDPTIDGLSVNGAGASLAIPTGRRITVLTDTQLQQGQIALDGALDTASLGISGGTLSGSGRVTASNGVAASGGLIAPGTPTTIGTLGVAGNYVQSGGATISVRAADGVSDKLAVTGAVALLGGTALIRADPARGRLRPEVDYDFVTATAGINGNFARTGTDLAFMEPRVTVGANAASFRVMRNATRFAAVATPNAAGVAQAIDSALGWNSALYGAIASSNARQAAQAFTLLSGESFASMGSVALDQSHYLRDALISRARREIDDSSGDRQAPSNARSEAWAQVTGSWGRIAGDSSKSSVDSASSGILAGIEHQFSDKFLGGIAAGFSQGNSNVNNRQTSSNIDSYHLALYGSTSSGPWRFGFGTGYTQHEVNSRRALSFAGYDDRLASSYQLRTLQRFGEVGYGLKLGQHRVEPFLNLAQVDLASSAFRESGGDAALAGRLKRQTVTYSTTGLRTTSQFDTSGAGRLTLTGMLGWQHAMGDTMPSAQARLLAGGQAFSVTGAPIARDTLNLQAGLAMRISTSTQLSFSYASKWASHAQYQALRADLRVQF